MKQQSPFVTWVAAALMISLALGLDILFVTLAAPHAYFITKLGIKMKSMWSSFLSSITIKKGLLQCELWLWQL